MTTAAFLQQIREDIARDDIETAIQQLQALLKNSPVLMNEVLLQSARWKAVAQQIRQGIIPYEAANVTQNQIRYGLLELISEFVNEIEGRAAALPKVRQEMAEAVSIANSQNVLYGSPISAGGNVHVGNIVQQLPPEKKDIPKILGNPPFYPDVFIGREEDLKAVHHRLFYGQHILLLVNGEGGIGKTTLAARYFFAYEEAYAHLAWVFAEKSLLDALLTLAIPLGVRFPQGSPHEAKLDLLLHKMRQLTQPCLLVIDNANRLQDLQDYYLKLNTCRNFHLLLTTRITKFKQADLYRIKALSVQAAEALFKQYYSRHQDSDHILFKALFEAVSSNTLVIELLAKNLEQWNELETKYSLSDLLNDLQSKGLLQVQGKTVSTLYGAVHRFREAAPKDIIAAMYDLGKLSEAEKRLMAVFAVLPAENIPFKILKRPSRCLQCNG